MFRGLGLGLKTILVHHESRVGSLHIPYPQAGAHENTSRTLRRKSAATEAEKIMPRRDVAWIGYRLPAPKGEF